MSLTATERLARARDAAAQVCDPEIPSLSIEDLGILRDVRIEAERIVVTLAPTYTACPATEAICDDVGAALETAGVAPFTVQVSLAPAWSSDWISAEGKRKLLEYGIAPPGPVAADGAVAIRIVGRRAAAVPCPRCGSAHTERLSAFGSTACKSLHRCLDCREPFEHFKPI